jgi:hypothetical protein
LLAQLHSGINNLEDDDKKKDKAEDKVVDANEGSNRMASFTLWRMLVND